MDKYERLMSQARAEWRAKRSSKGFNSLWGFENWASERKEDHHIARKKFGAPIMPVPISMHRELTRRQTEEHPPEGTDPSHPLERKGRLALGLADILESIADAFRQISDDLIGAAGLGARDLDEGAEIPEELATLIRLVSGRLIEIALNRSLDLKE